MNKNILIDDFEYVGNWWLPDSPEDIVGGKVSFKNGRIMLELHKHFSMGSKTTEDQFQPPVIHGLSRGTKITLYKTREHNANNPDGPTFFGAEYLLTGKHFDEEPALSSLTIRFTHLEEWIDKEPFDVDLQGGPSGQGSIIYSPPEPVEFRVPKAGCRLQLAHATKPGLGDFRSVTWEHSACINIASESDTELVDWYPDILFSLSRLLSLLVGRTVTPIELWGHVPDEGEHTADGLVQGHVHVFIDGFRRPSQEQQELPWFFRVLVPLPDLESNIGKVFDSWFEQAEKLKPVYDLYLATLDSTNMYVEFEFLALSQALETFHRRAMPPGKYLTDEEWAEHRNELIAEIPEAIGADHRSSLKNRLKYGHEYSLRKRLTELLDRVGDDTKALLADNPNDFIGRVVDTRNYLTHYEEGPRGWAGDFTGLVEATRRLRRLLAALLWQQLGIDGAAIQDAASRIEIDPYRT